MFAELVLWECVTLTSLDVSSRRCVTMPDARVGAMVFWVRTEVRRRELRRMPHPIGTRQTSYSAGLLGAQTDHNPLMCADEGIEGLCSSAYALSGIQSLVPWWLAKSVWVVGTRSNV